MSDSELRRQSRFTWMLIAFTVIFVCFMARPLRAQNFNWDGDNASGDFLNSNNWYGDTIPSFSFSGNLVFNYRNNAAQTSQYYNFAGWANASDIIWETTWGAATTFNGNGQGINFNQRIENRSSFTVTIGSMNLSGAKNGATQIELNPVNGDLTLNGNIYNDNNVAYRTYGGNSKLLTVNTALSGNANVAYSIEGYSKVLFTAAQTFGGSSTFDVKTGELWLGTGGSLTSGMMINLGLNDAGTAKFYLTGTATDSHNITVANNNGVKVVGTLGSGGATNTFSGNITNNSTSGGVLLENTTNGVANFTGVISGTGSVQIGGGATGSTAATVILAGNNTFSGPLYLSAGTLSITNANSLGRGQIQFGNAGISTILLANSNTTITNQFRVNNAATNAAINVASGATLTISGQTTQDSTKVNSTKYGKDGAGTLVLSGTNSDYNGQLQVGQGTVIVGANNALGTNVTTSARGVDLGLNVGDVTTTNNVSLLASNGVTVAQSIYIAPNSNSATRTIGLSGNGTNTFTNQFYLDGNMIVAVGSAATDRVNLTGNITNTGGLIKTNSGFLNLSASNSYTGGTTLALGSTGGILIGHDNAFGTGGVTNLADGGTFQSDTTRTVANNFRLDNNTLFTGSGSLTINGTLSISASPDLTNNLTGGLTLNNLTLGSSGTSRTLSLRGTGTTTINGVISNAASQTTNNFVIGSGSGTNSLTILNGNNTYTGGTTINSGATVRLGHANGLGSTAAGTSISTLGGALDLNGMTGVAESFTGGGSGVSSSGMFFNSSASAASVTGTVTLTANTTVGVTNGAITLSGAISESGGVRQFTKTGSGTLTLSGANSFSGAFNFNGGTLVVGNDSALGTGAADFVSDVTLNSDSSARTITNAITFRNLTVGGTGALTLSGTNTHTASSNTLTNNNSGGLTMGALNLSGTATGRTMTLAGTGNTTISGEIANGPLATTGGITVVNSGTTILSGNNTYDGLTTMNSATGILTLSGNNSGAAGGVTLTAGTLNINNNNALGSGALSLAGTGATINNTSGSAVVNAGNQAWSWSDGLAFGSSTNTSANNLDLGTGVVTASSSRSISLAGTGTRLTIGAVNITSTSTGRTITANGAGNTLEMKGLTLSGNTTAAVTVTLAGTADLAVSGAIVNGQAFANGLNLTGTGTTTFSGLNTYTGDTTISAGTLVLSGTNSGSGSVILGASSAVFKIGRTNSLVNGNLAGASSSANAGLVDLTAGGNYSVASFGNTANSGANLIFTNSSGQATSLTFTAATNIISSGSNGSRAVTNASSNLNLIFSGVVDIGGTSGSSVTFDGPGNYTFNGAITNSSGTRSLIKGGAGTLTINAASSYNGATTINGGVLATGVNEAIQDGSTVSIAAGATFRLGGNETVAQANSTSSTSTIDLQSNTLTIGGTGLSYTNSALTTGTGGKVVKNGAGLLYLDNSANSYSGGFTLNAGDVQFTSSGTASAGVLSSSVFGTGTLTLAGGSIATSSSAGTSGRNINNSIILNGTVQMGQNAWGSTNANMNGGTALLTFTTNGSGTTTLQGDSTINTLGAVLWNQGMSGNFRLTKTGTGANALMNNYLKLTASNNIGGVTVSSGVLGYQNRNALGTGTLILADGVQVMQDGILNNASPTGNDRTDRAVANAVQINGNVTFGGGGYANHFGGNVDLSAANRTITLSNTTFFYGQVTNGGLVIDNGSGSGNRTLYLYGTNNFSGGTVVNSNAIVGIGTDNALGSGSLIFTNTSGANTSKLLITSLATNASQSRTVTNNIGLASGINVTLDSDTTAQDSVGANATINVDSTLSGAITGAGALTKAGASTVTLSAANTYSGGTTVSAGTLLLSGSGTLGASNGALTISAGTVNLGGLTRTNGAFTLDSGTLSNGTLSASSYALTNAGTISAVLAGSGAVTKTGTGTAVLSGANTYSGGTTISAGTLQGDTTSVQGGVTNNATLLFSQTSAGSYSGAVSGSGAVTVDGNGSGVVTLSGNNTYSGLTTVTNGTLRLGSSTALGGGGTDWTTAGTRLSVGGTLDLNGQNIANEALGMASASAVVTNSSTTTAIWGGSITMTNGTNQFNVGAGRDITLNGSLSGTASRQLMKNGDGVLTVAGTANTNSGAININAGTFRMGNATALGSNGSSNDVTVATGATLDLNGYTAVTTIKPIKLSGTGVAGAGALQNSASGTTAIVSNAVVLNADASIGGAGNITTAGGVSGAARLTKDGSGTLTLSANTFSGGFTMNGGTVALASANAFGSGDVTLNAGTIGSITSARTIANNFIIGGNITLGTGAQSTTFNGGFDLGGAARTFTLGNTVTFNGQITNGGMVFNAGAGGARNITLAGSNSFAGGLGVNGGNTLFYTNGNSLGTGTVTLAGNSVLRASNSTTTATDITITSGNTGYVETAAGTTNTLNGKLTKNGSVLVLGGGGTHVVNGFIVGSNSGSDLVISNSTTTINSANSYNGPTFIVAAGTLNNGTNNALPTDTALTLGQANETSSTTNTYNLNGFSQTVASVASVGNSVNVITNSTGSGNLTLNSSVDRTLSNLRIGGDNFTLTKAGNNTLIVGSSSTIGGISTIAIQSGTLLLGAANQIGDTTAITMAGGTLNTGGFGDSVGKLTVSANSTIQGMNSISSGGSAFTFSDVDLSNYSTSSGSTVTFLGSGGSTYSLGTVIQLSTQSANLWTGYDSTSLNNFRTKISFSDANLRAQINFGGGISGTTLTVAAIPEPKVYMAAAGLMMLIGMAEYRRRKKTVSSKA